MKYLIIGVYPPPLGGISVYIYRLSKKLKAEGFSVVNLDFAKLSKLKKILALVSIIIHPRSTEYILNDFNVNIMLALLLRPFPKKVSFVDHNQREIENFNSIRKTILRYFILKIDELVFVNKKIIEYYELHKVKLPSKFKISPAFIEPPLDEEFDILNTYSDDEKKFITSHNPLLLANAYQINFYNGDDLYGLDLCVSLVARLKKKFPNIGFVFALADNSVNRDYVRLMDENILKLNISDNFKFITGQKQIWPLFKMVHLMLRPTNTDGDALSIREALHFGCAVLASDVCQRPDGTVIHKSRDVDDMFSKSLEILKNANLKTTKF